jgi:hypothetical protein
VSDRIANVKSYVPIDYRETEPLKSIYEATGTETGLLFDRIIDALSQFFVAISTAWGLTRWESDLDLPDGTGQTLSERRSRIISKIRGAGASTKSLIETVAESYDNGDIEIIEDNANYQFTVKFISTYGVPSNLIDLQTQIEEIKPAHLAVLYEYLYTLYSDLEDNTHAELNAFTHDYIRNNLT